MTTVVTTEDVPAVSGAGDNALTNEPESVEAVSEAAVEIAEVEAERDVAIAEIRAETEQAAIEADAETRQAEADAQVEAAEVVADAIQSEDTWRTNMETRMAALETVASSIQATLTASQSPTSPSENAEGGPPEAATPEAVAEAPPEPRRKSPVRFL